MNSNDNKILNLLKNASLNEGAGEKLIAEAEVTAGLLFPEDYKALLKHSNGCEGFLSDGSYVVIWPVDQVVELNDSYSIKEFAPGVLLFGTNGADDGYGFDTRASNFPVVSVPLVGMRLSEVQPCANTLSEFLDASRRKHK